VQSLSAAGEQRAASALFFTGKGGASFLFSKQSGYAISKEKDCWEKGP